MRIGMKIGLNQKGWSIKKDIDLKLSRELETDMKSANDKEVIEGEGIAQICIVSFS